VVSTAKSPRQRRAGGSVDTTKLKEPIVGFVFGQKGLMAGISLEGLKFTKTNPE